MGYIPLFLTVGGACLLFFLTVKTSLQRKLNLQKELLTQLSLAFPELQLTAGSLVDPDVILEKLKKSDEKKSKIKDALKVVRELKYNRIQYNQLIKKAPYNWVAKISGFQPI
ncbi:hypothetical protein SAMN04488519_10253 [Algoriphagus ornithinivorans]|uniref:LemA protein n=1 Tax=Algoriphagus ornithinivorans TaxID=226506 RepID=A0A1I5BVH3_9BACT|nr:hypothetical protein [Algoriphagus ornithinivorans]SFN78700.1 hypothetical protein SAMN04488519_10253 [Algoriphagus ornithinivorans]